MLSTNGSSCERPLKIHRHISRNTEPRRKLQTNRMRAPLSILPSSRNHNPEITRPTYYLISREPIHSSHIYIYNYYTKIQSSQLFNACGGGLSSPARLSHPTGLASTPPTFIARAAAAAAALFKFLDLRPVAIECPLRFVFFLWGAGCRGGKAARIGKMLVEGFG